MDHRLWTFWLHSRSDDGGLTDRQVASLIILERVGATASLLAICTIFVTFWAFKRLRTVPNLFILMASVANAGAGAACIIGHDGILSGNRSSLCEAQAFMLEMLMQSDPWWSLAMAVNVFLVFFYGVSTALFKKYLWLYSVVCFGAPLVPAVALLVLNDEGGHNIIGDATLWCWIEPQWSALRIYTYYLPIWICIVISAMIYVAVGCHVFHRRNQLRNLTLSNQGRGQVINDSFSWEGNCGLDKAVVPGQKYYGTAVTRIEIQLTGLKAPRDSGALKPMEERDSMEMSAISVPPAIAKKSWMNADSNQIDKLGGIETKCTSHGSCPQILVKQQLKVFVRLPASFRAFISNLVWRYQRVDAIKKAYLRTSAIFALSVLFTWMPSSINRVASLLNPKTVNYPLNVASAFVLPLQGVWNAVIYFSTSWGPLCVEMGLLAARLGGRDSKAAVNMAGRCGALQHSCFKPQFSEEGSEPDSSQRLGEIRAMRGSF